MQLVTINHMFFPGDSVWILVRSFFRFGFFVLSRECAVWALVCRLLRLRTSRRANCAACALVGARR